MHTFSVISGFLEEPTWQHCMYQLASTHLAGPNCDLGNIHHSTAQIHNYYLQNLCSQERIEDPEFEPLINDTPLSITMPAHAKCTK